MPRDRIARNLLILPRLLRRADLSVDPGRARSFLSAVAEIDPSREDDVRAAARATLVAHATDMARFEETFDLWIGLLGGSRPEAWRVDVLARRLDRGATIAAPLDRPGHDLETRGRRDALRAASRIETLGGIDFGVMTPDERAAAARFLEDLAWSPGLRPSRRFRQSRRGASFDARATLRRGLRTLGEPIVLRRRDALPKRRPVVVICDISGSMEPYVRLLLHMTHALTRAWGRLEAFTFGTRLTRITRDLRHRRADLALARVAGDVRDWSGGTRIGESLRVFNRRWSRRVLTRGAIVLLCTDGWEQGDPAELSREVERLRRASYRLLWLDPLSGTRGYAAESAGARALDALADDHLAANTIDGLRGVAAALGRAGRFRPARRH